MTCPRCNDTREIVTDITAYRGHEVTAPCPICASLYPPGFVLEKINLAGGSPVAKGEPEGGDLLSHLKHVEDKERAELERLKAKFGETQ